MATFAEVSEGLTILAKYVESTSHAIAAEHDIIYAGPDETLINEDDEESNGSVVSEEDATRLRELGWHIDSETTSWARFV